jgi:hypothetical protein
MFGPRSKSFEQLEHYLEVRPNLRKEMPNRPALGIGTAAFVGASVIALMDHGPAVVLLAVAGMAGMFGYRFFSSMQIKPPTHEAEVMGEADNVARKLRELSARRRLHLVLHPGIGAVLDECAGYWKQIQDLSNSRVWQDARLSGQWTTARQEWLGAADFAMAEALLLAEPGLTLRPSRPRAEELVEDLLDTYVFQKGKGREDVLPVRFKPLRELAEKMSTLVTEVKAARDSMGTERVADPQPDATSRLDEVLSNLRSINEAEEELQRHLKQSS